MYKANTKSVVAIAAAMLTASCATGPDGKPQGVADTLKANFASNDPCSNNARNIGAIGGALAGVVVGKLVGAKGAAMVAAGAVGALAGGLIGSDMDRRRCDLSKVAKAHNLDIVMTDIMFDPNVQATQQAAAASTPAASTELAKADTKPQPVGMSFTVFDRGNQFAVGSGVPSPETAEAFSDVAQKYRAIANNDRDPQQTGAATERNRKMRILLIGHTDDTGPSQLNADLSEARARAIAKIFAEHGFSEAQVFYQGAGEVFPIADNRTEEGRARNRRVEVIDLSDDAVFAAFLDSRRPNVGNYRPAPTMDAATRVSSAPPAKGGSQPSARTAATAPPPAPTPSGSASKPAPAASRTALAAPAADGLDFGGQPFNDKSPTADIGRLKRTDTFSIISTAYAAEGAPLSACANDRPRISNRVKALSTGRDYKSADYLPGTAAASWSGRVNGHLVGLTDVAVLRDGGQPASRPTVYVWKNYVDGSHAKPDLKTSGEVNAYQGDKALLYRVFPVDGPLRCIDMVIPNGAPNTAPASSFIYAHARTLYRSDFSPTITR